MRRSAPSCPDTGLLWDNPAPSPPTEQSAPLVKPPEIERQSSLIHPECPRPRSYQDVFLRIFGEDSSRSFLLQSPTGSGKTFTALYAVADQLEAGKRVVFVVPTIDLLQQTEDEARIVFGQECRFVRTLSGKDGLEGRREAYQDEGARLLIVTAPSAAKDIASGVLTIEDLGCLILDEGDLTRGKEPLGEIVRFRKAMTQPPPTIIMSATLTEADNPSQDHPEVRSLKRQTGISTFIQLLPDSKSAYTIQSEKLHLPESVAHAARELQADYLARLLRIKDLIEDHMGEAAEAAQAYVLKFLEAYRKKREFALPSVKIEKGLPDVLKSLVKGRLNQPRSHDKENAWEAVRLSYELISLNHAHELLVNGPRVGFLEFAGAMLCASRLETGKPHHARIFPPGRTPSWWHSMARDTPYALLERINRANLAPMVEFLEDRGVNFAPLHQAITDAQRDRDQKAQKKAVLKFRSTVLSSFFSSGRALGHAASALMHCRFDEHHFVRAVENYIRGPIRKSYPAQILVTTRLALGARYLAEYFAAHSGEETVALVGGSHTNDSVRSSSFERARSGHATIVCGTSVVGRGIDLPALGLLLDGNPSPDIRTAKQQFGRIGRKAPGLVVSLKTQGSSAEMYDLVRRTKAESRQSNFPERRINRQRKEANFGGRLFEF